MSVEKVTEQTASRQRPLIDENGVTHPMTEEQYAAFLEQEALAPTRPAGPTVGQEIAALKEELRACKILLGMEEQT